MRDEIRIAELTNALRAFQFAEKIADEKMVLLLLECIAVISRRIYVAH